MRIPRIGKVITIWEKIFFKTRVSFDGLVISSNHIETHPDVVAEILEVQRSVAFEFCLDEDFIELW